MVDCSYAFRFYGAGSLKASDNTINTCTWGFRFENGAGGDADIIGNMLLSLGMRPLEMPLLHTVNLNIDGNYIYNPCRDTATYCWYFYCNGSTVFRNNITKVTDNRVSYWFSIDTSSHDETFIDGNTFLGSPTVGKFSPGGKYRVGANNVGLWSLSYNSAAPTSGTYSQGDRVVNATPAVGQPKGWICTVGGTPGTWVSEGNL